MRASQERKKQQQKKGEKKKCFFFLTVLYCPKQTIQVIPHPESLHPAADPWTTPAGSPTWSAAVVDSANSSPRPAGALWLQWEDDLVDYSLCHCQVGTAHVANFDLNPTLQLVASAHSVLWTMLPEPVRHKSYSDSKNVFIFESNICYYLFHLFCYIETVTFYHIDTYYVNATKSNQSN